ncbi:ribose-phosphate pyrophosphokinase [bacterium]|nr:ribose-phosphate pyrophosphokinase [candidate division CSSED10-310 bacterium]
MPGQNYELEVFYGSAHPELGLEICKCLNIEPGQVETSRFADNEIFVQIKENIRGKDVFIVQPTCFPTNSNLMELLILIDTALRASAKRITAVLPYYGYARQDRKDRPRVPITARLVADLITVAGANRVLTMDLHAGQIQGFFKIPVDHLYATPVFLDHIKQMDYCRNLMVVSPDAGGVERAKFLAKLLGVELAVADKRRSGPNVAESIRIIGNVKGRNVLIIDDIIDTAGTLMKAVNALMEAGADRVIACGTHGVFSPPALERIQNNEHLVEVIVTNTIAPRKDLRCCSKVKVLTIAPLLAEAIKRIHFETSISSLFV